MESEAPPADEAELLKQFLASRDVACPHCQYNLRNLIGGVCPECGEAVVLRVQPLEPRLAAPITGLVILSAGAGLNGLLLICMAIQEVFYVRGGSQWKSFLVVNAAELTAMAICLAAWLGFWRRIRRLPRMQRWLLVFVCLLATTIDLICFSKFIR